VAKSSIIAGIIVVIVVGMILIFLILSMMTPRTQEPKFDIYEEISILNEEFSESWQKYTLHEADWKVRKNQSEAIGITFVEMSNWDEFKENLKQSTRLIYTDEENRVIWYGKYHIIYLYY